MHDAIRRLVMAALALGVLAAGSGNAAAEGVELRISLDTSPTHVRTVWATRFAELVKERSGGRIEPEVFHSAQLFRDRDVAKALRQQTVEMAIPGTWVLGGFEKRFDVIGLPMFYGRTPDEYHAFSDGDLGHELSASLESKLNVKVLGDWFDLGASHLYFAGKTVETHADLDGLKIRYPGSASLAKRVEQLGGVPTLVAWPDVPLGLSRHNFDGLISTHESLKSAKLWESGVTAAFEDYQSFGQYVPLVSKAFWDKLSPDLQQVMVDTWKEIVPRQREDAMAKQAEAGEVLAGHGVTIVQPSRGDIVAKRTEMMKGQPEIADDLGLDADYVVKVRKALDALDAEG